MHYISIPQKDGSRTVCYYDKACMKVDCPFQHTDTIISPVTPLPNGSTETEQQKEQKKPKAKKLVKSFNEIMKEKQEQEKEQGQKGLEKKDRIVEMQDQGRTKGQNKTQSIVQNNNSTLVQQQPKQPKQQRQQQQQTTAVNKKGGNKAENRKRKVQQATSNEDSSVSESAPKPPLNFGVKSLEQLLKEKEQGKETTASAAASTSVRQPPAKRLKQPAASQPAASSPQGSRTLSPSATTKRPREAESPRQNHLQPQTKQPKQQPQKELNRSRGSQAAAVSAEDDEYMRVQRELRELGIDLDEGDASGLIEVTNEDNPTSSAAAAQIDDDELQRLLSEE